MSQRQNGARIIRQKKQCNALNDADESQLDVNDNRIELAAARVQWIHPASGNRLAIRMSRLLGTAGSWQSVRRMSALVYSCAMLAAVRPKRRERTASWFRLMKI